MSKIFSEEIQKIYDRLQKNTPFAFSKYADGEWLAMRGVVGSSGNGEWVINNGDNSYEISRQKLISSFQYKDPEYYIGISCPCCQGQHHYDMKTFSGQDEDHVTFANVFVNSNYDFYIKNFIPEFSKRDIYLIANKVTDLANLPFKVEKFFPIEYNAWLVNLDLIDQLQNENVENKLFLFSAGPFGNILSAELWKTNKKNTYLDVGSTLDPWTKANRLIGKYYTPGSPDRNKTCVWG
jgi:hypothetical protein